MLQNNLLLQNIKIILFVQLILDQVLLSNGDFPLVNPIYLGWVPLFFHSFMQLLCYEFFSEVKLKKIGLIPTMIGMNRRTMNDPTIEEAPTR